MFNRKLKERIESLENDMVERVREYDRLFSRHNALLAHLGLHEVTEPATPEKRKFLTEEEYQKRMKDTPSSMTATEYMAHPATFPYFRNLYKDNH